MILRSEGRQGQAGIIITLVSGPRGRENIDISDSTNNSLIGPLKGTYRVKLSLGYFMPHLLLLFVALLGLGIFVGADPGWKTYTEPE